MNAKHTWISTPAIKGLKVCLDCGAVRGRGNLQCPGPRAAEAPGPVEWEDCERCEGLGELLDEYPEIGCPDCDGTGRICSVTDLVPENQS